MIKRDLFRTVRLVRNWGSFETKGQQLVEIYQDENAAAQALDAIQQAKGSVDTGTCTGAQSAATTGTITSGAYLHG